MGELGWAEISSLALAAAFTLWVLALGFVCYLDRRSRQRTARNLWADCAGRGPDGQRLEARACPICQGPMRFRATPKTGDRSTAEHDCPWCGASATDGTRGQQPSEPGAEPACRPAEIGPQGQSGYWCGLCGYPIPGQDGTRQPHDPCLLHVVINYDGHRQSQTHMEMCCHYDCLRRAMARPELLDQVLGIEPRAAPDAGR